MHETVIAHTIINEAKKHGDVQEIFLEVGELAHVPLHDLLPCLRSLVPWKIHAKEVPAISTCDCGYAGHPTILERGHDAFVIECPTCREVPMLTGGTDIMLAKVRVI